VTGGGGANRLRAHGPARFAAQGAELAVLDRDGPAGAGGGGRLAAARPRAGLRPHDPDQG